MDSRTSNYKLSTLMPSDSWPAGLVTNADHARFERYQEARAFIKGRQWEGRKRPGERRMTLNYARTLIRKVASYVFPDVVTFTVPDNGDSIVANRAEQMLQAAIVSNDLGRLDFELNVEAAVIGDAAIKVTWDAKQRQPSVVAVDPGTLAAKTSPDNPRRITSLSQHYQMTGHQFQQLFGDHLLRAIDPDRVLHITELWADASWRVYVQQEMVLEQENPYGWIPYVVTPNNPEPYSFWGTSDLVDLYDVCRELNARMSVISKILTLSGAPIVVLENVDGSDNVSVGPGAKWELPKDARAYLLDLLSQGGMRLHNDYIDLLYRTMHDLSETPRTAFGDSGRTLSGAALEVEIQPLVQKVARKRRQWDGFYQERNARILHLLEAFGGLDLGGLRRTAPVWPGILPSDRDSAVRNTVSLVEAGITSRRTAIAELGGLDPEGELRRIEEEKADGLGSPVPPVTPE